MMRRSAIALVAPLFVAACSSKSTPFNDVPEAGGVAGGGASGRGGAGSAGKGDGGASAGRAGASGGAGKGGSSSGGAAGRGGSGGAGKTGSGGGAGELAGSGGLGGASGRGGTAGASGGGGAGGGDAGAGGSGGGCGGCDWECCGSTCVNKGNDIKNCGDCGNECSEGESCNDGECGEPPCTAPIPCEATQFCCGTSCCDEGQICCTVPGPVGPSLPTCTQPSELGTCPTGCQSCKCAAPNTMIATPQGDRPIEELEVGDLVYSVDGEAIVAVPILATKREPAQGHAVPRLSLKDGGVLEISAGHPTADGRFFADLRPGDRLGEARVTAVVTVPYPYAFTYDILPASSTHAYFAGGALIGSTFDSGDACR